MSCSVTCKYKSSSESNALSYSSKSGTLCEDEAITAQVEGVLSDMDFKYKALRALLWRTTNFVRAGIAQDDRKSSEITACAAQAQHEITAKDPAAYEKHLPF